MSDYPRSASFGFRPDRPGGVGEGGIDGGTAHGPADGLDRRAAPVRAAVVDVDVGPDDVDVAFIIGEWLPPGRDDQTSLGVVARGDEVDVVVEGVTAHPELPALGMKGGVMMDPGGCSEVAHDRHEDDLGAALGDAPDRFTGRGIHANEQTDANPVEVDDLELVACGDAVLDLADREVDFAIGAE